MAKIFKSQSTYIYSYPFSQRFNQYLPVAQSLTFTIFSNRASSFKIGSKIKDFNFT